MKRFLFSTICMTIFFGYAHAQQDLAKSQLKLGEKPDSAFSLTRKSPVVIDFDQEEEEEEDKDEKKDKRKKNVFYGIKTKKGFTRRGFGKNLTLELFHYLKEPPQELDPFVPEIYWYDKSQRKVKATQGFDPRKGYVLHGPYKVLIDDNIVEEGIFYNGMKHGRWTKYDRSGILTDKRKYNKGWPKESVVTYYGQDREKLKEIIPIVYDKKNGDYFFFHENGSVAIKGEYKNDVKVGRWIEFYPFLDRRKKEIMYPTDPYDDETEPYINREWNKRGQTVYERKVD